MLARRHNSVQYVKGQVATMTITLIAPLFTAAGILVMVVVGKVG
jgi:hypothetical protein